MRKRAHHTQHHSKFSNAANSAIVGRSMVCSRVGDAELLGRLHSVVKRADQRNTALALRLSLCRGMKPHDPSDQASQLGCVNGCPRPVHP